MQLDYTSLPMQPKQQRPKFLNLFKIHLPVTGVVSIVHRISGALLFLAIPPFIYIFNLSLTDEESFLALSEAISNPVFKVIITLLGWALAHHLMAGIRYLLTDVAIGLSLPAARRSAWIVNFLSAAALAGLILVLWL